MNTPAAYCVGIAGGTGSGKTTLTQSVCGLLGSEIVTVIEADYYYRDLSHISAAKRHLVNFDHPDALDFDLMTAHMYELRQGRTVRMSAYDFTTHCRTDRMISLLPRPIILIEGILVLSCQQITRLLDLKVYIDELPELRKKRRMQRDIRKRKRTPDMFSLQYEKYVLPMHARYVEPCKDSADIILSNSNETDQLLSLLHVALSKRIGNTEANHREPSRTPPDGGM